MKCNGYFVNCKHFKKGTIDKDYYLVNYILICQDCILECYTSFISKELFDKLQNLNIKPLKQVFFIFDVGPSLKARLIDIQ